MRKIPLLWQRDEITHQLRPLVNPVAAWVLEGLGQPTRKYDGVCALVRDGALYRRLEVKAGKGPPAGFEPVDYDPVTGHTVGWLPIGDGPEDRYFRAAWALYQGIPLRDGTYELCGPKVQGNPEGFGAHVLIQHGYQPLFDVPRTFEGLRDYLASHDMEGIVFWESPGDLSARLCKLRLKDYGLKRPRRERS